MANVQVKSTVTIGALTRWFGVCNLCHHALPPLEESGPRYFSDGSVECIGCHASVDLWECCRSQIDDEFPPEWGLQGLGAQFSLFPFEVRAGQVVTVDLTQHGIPSDAILLYSAYQSDDVRAIPRLLELYTRQMAQDPKHQAVYCMPVAGGSTEIGRGRAFVCWIPRGTEAQWSTRLAYAFRDVASHDFEGTIVEAFSAVDIALFSFISRYVERTCASKAFRKALTGRLSSAEMMQLLSDICDELNVRPLPKPVSDALHALRRCRNSILHRGVDEKLTASSVGEFLAAALLGVAFVRYVESHAV